MPMPRRTDVEDVLRQLSDAQRPHLLQLRRLSLAADPDVTEQLRYGVPGYALGGEQLWMLQPFARHCSLRFSTEFFAAHRADVERAGEQVGEGFVKLPYDRALPTALLEGLMAARVAAARAAGGGAGA